MGDNPPDLRGIEDLGGLAKPDHARRPAHRQINFRIGCEQKITLIIKLKILSYQC